MLYRGSVGDGAQFRRGEVESYPVPAWGEVDQRFEVGITDRPAGGRKCLPFFIMMYCEVPVEGSLLRVADLAIDKKDFGVDLSQRNQQLSGCVLVSRRPYH